MEEKLIAVIQEKRAELRETFESRVKEAIDKTKLDENEKSLIAQKEEMESELKDKIGVVGEEKIKADIKKIESELYKITSDKQEIEANITRKDGSLRGKFTKIEKAVEKKAIATKEIAELEKVIKARTIEKEQYEKAIEEEKDPRYKEEILKDLEKINNELKEKLDLREKNNKILEESSRTIEKAIKEFNIEALIAEENKEKENFEKEEIQVEELEENNDIHKENEEKEDLEKEEVKESEKLEKHIDADIVKDVINEQKQKEQTKQLPNKGAYVYNIISDVESTIEQDVKKQYNNIQQVKSHTNEDTMIEEADIEITFDSKSKKILIDGKVLKGDIKDESLFLEKLKENLKKNNIENDFSKVDINIVKALYLYDEKNEINGTEKLEQYLRITGQDIDPLEMEDKLIEAGLDIHYDLRGMYDKKEDGEFLYTKEEREKIFNIAKIAERSGIATVKKGFLVSLKEFKDRIAKMLEIRNNEKYLPEPIESKQNNIKKEEKEEQKSEKEEKNDKQSYYEKYPMEAKIEAKMKGKQREEETTKEKEFRDRMSKDGIDTENECIVLNKENKTNRENDINIVVPDFLKNFVPKGDGDNTKKNLTKNDRDDR